jgi:hypothetical protein
MTEEQAAATGLRTRLRSAVNGHEISFVDLPRAPLPLLEGDVVLAGSDGLQTLTDEAIGEVVARNLEAEASVLSVRVVQSILAEQHPKQDNTTAAILKPPAEWLFAPFAFAPPPPEPEVEQGDAANTTQRIVPRSLRPPAGEQPTPAP